MTNKVTKAGSISRRRLLTTASADAALAVSPFRINLLQAQEAPIKIGFPVPLTGPYGAEAQDQVRAGQLAVAQFNDAGGLNGRKAELVVRDDKLNPGEAATRTLELVEKEKVNFVVGSLSAAVQLAINNVTKERGVIFNSISQSDAINEAADFSKYTFHEALNPHMTSGAVGRYAFTKFGKKVAFSRRIMPTVTRWFAASLRSARSSTSRTSATSAIRWERPISRPCCRVSSR